jgi:hypothetical protein
MEYEHMHCSNLFSSFSLSSEYYNSEDRWNWISNFFPCRAVSSLEHLYSILLHAQLVEESKEVVRWNYDYGGLNRIILWKRFIIIHIERAEFERLNIVRSGRKQKLLLILSFSKVSNVQSGLFRVLYSNNNLVYFILSVLYWLVRANVTCHDIKRTCGMKYFGIIIMCVFMKLLFMLIIKPTDQNICAEVEWLTN